jgi:hypothetical protein
MRQYATKTTHRSVLQDQTRAIADWFVNLASSFNPYGAEASNLIISFVIREIYSLVYCFACNLFH